ncbi:neuroguidin [Halyomorpha halys]|uniref:neuroguidin n=1 Tax=Halyomorpha halys TaxID=286706 RepID=UPI0006D4F468|nr:neuroguidin [Halyomorpha halys]
MNGVEHMSDQKEALTIFKNLKEVGSQVLTLVNTLKNRVVNNQLGVDNGISLLDVKNQLMIQYLLNLAQLIILKTTGKSIEGSSALDRVIENRIILEKCKPIEQKLKYQIEKYVKRSIVGSVDDKDPSRFKANPEDFLEGSDEDEDEDEVADQQSEKNKDKKKPGVYVPPRLTSVPYDDERSVDKQNKLLERSRNHALRSSVIQELKEEYLDIPVEVKATNSVQQKEDKYQKMKKEYEESYFTRLPVTKEEKRKSKLKFSMGQLSNELTHFEDTSILLGDTSVLSKKRKRLHKKGKGKIKKKRKMR